MDKKQKIIKHWRDFFTDLFVGTFLKVFLYGLLGTVLGFLSLWGFHWGVLGSVEWKPWVEMTVLVLGFLWFPLWGVFGGVVSAAFQILWKKFVEIVSGMHDLLDLLTREVLAQFPRFSKQTPKEELAKKFDNIGQDFLTQLKLKGGLIRFVARIFFGTILKVLKFFFLNDVVEELAKNPNETVTSSDIEHAVRRVGVDLFLEPIHENFILLQILFAVLIIILIGLPFGLLYFF